jgi:predicted DCC family thiol-disulfide oxidoreductase YuxK
MPENDNGRGKDVDIQAFYDGDCSVCSQEVEWLHEHDADGRIQFVDIAAPGFDADRDAGIPIVRVQDCIQVRLATGEIIEGAAALRHLYGTVSSPRLTRVTHVPLISPVLELGYRLFAKNRQMLARRRVSRTCTGSRRPG